MQLEGYLTCCLKTANERHFIKSSKLIRWIRISPKKFRSTVNCLFIPVICMKDAQAIEMMVTESAEECACIYSQKAVSGFS